MVYVLHVVADSSPAVLASSGTVYSSIPENQKAIQEYAGRMRCGIEAHAHIERSCGSADGTWLRDGFCPPDPRLALVDAKCMFDEVGCYIIRHLHWC